VINAAKAKLRLTFLTPAVPATTGTRSAASRIVAWRFDRSEMTVTLSLQFFVIVANFYGLSNLTEDSSDARNALFVQCGGIVAPHHWMRAALCLLLPISVIKQMITQRVRVVSIGTRPRSGCKQGGCHDGQLYFVA
jgi:hypothetical protein